MTRDNRKNRFAISAVILLALTHRTSGGSWRNLESKFIQDHHRSRNWDENRIIFPDTKDESGETSWRPTTKRAGEQEECRASCPVSGEDRPVCGTDGITYQNIAQLQCAMICGVDVDLHRPLPCYTEVTSNTPSTPTTPITSTSTSTNLEVEWCIKLCPTTPEYNPVCGTNSVTYHNIGKLECAKYCGVDVQLHRHNPCPSILITTTPAPTTNVVNDVVTEICIQNCPATSQYDPVCGTDNVTYNNIGRLECAKACGVDVNVLKRLPCSVSIETTSEEDYDDKLDVRYPGPKARRYTK